jgi:hypothetical protein
MNFGACQEVNGLVRSVDFKSARYRVWHYIALSSFEAIKCYHAPVAQLDRASDYESEG